MSDCSTALTIRLYGIVQGVGFRPFVSRIAGIYHITGSVANKGSFVEIHAQGKKENIEKFLRELKDNPPPRSMVLKTDILEREEIKEKDFSIIESFHEAGDIFVSPDIAVCPECKKELYAPGDSRYLHPFINCTACGPRLTILDAMPYDRERTSMKEFPMCPECASEYNSPESRRYDAQPVCCNECGPELYLVGRKEKGRDALQFVRRAIMEGQIVAIKGIGGFHLCCDARNSEAVNRLRILKRRPVKPFAVMMQNLETVRKNCEIPPGIEALLDGWQKPIVLLKKKSDSALPEVVAPGNPSIGVMLPYAPLHLLLFDYDDDVKMSDTLVMTSGNLSGAPICRNDEDALEQIASFCDVLLSHNRRIRLRADDSVLDLFNGEPYMIRRSRGYAPLPFRVSGGFKGEVLGMGGELKNTFCPAKDELFYPSAYLGDLADLRTVNALEESVARMDSLLEITPQLIACDLHPRYNSTAVAEKMGIPLIKVQHHYAHIAACMAENDYSSPVIGISFDGTGYGTDGTVWGGEFMKADFSGFNRLGSIAPFRQAGGDASSREGWRIAAALAGAPDDPATLSLLNSLEMGKSEAELKFQLKMIEKQLNCISSTSSGRLFDGVSALLGICTTSTFEGEAAMKLQFAAQRYKGESAFELTGFFAENDNSFFQLDTLSLVKQLIAERLKGKDPIQLAWTFHAGLASLIAAGARRCREMCGIGTCALSGGVFQNTLLLELVIKKLEKDGFNILHHRLIPPNDGGIALGQAVIAMYQLNKKD
ncbi:MAG: carbamoyltransferase HypF [Lentisphaeria bacterium]|nr:carbamoyltransferase HypF [Lentisphaeria bacterium]